MRHVRRYDGKRSTGDAVFKMETEISAQRKCQLVGMVGVLGDTIGRIGARGHVEDPQAAALPECNSPCRHRVHGATLQPRRLRNKRRQTLTEVKRNEFAITETEDNAIAAAAIIGDRRSPVIG